MPKRILSGVVVSSNSNKTITVDVTRRIKHKLYKKIIKQNKKYHAHDENNEFNVGDIVSIIETKPISKLKSIPIKKNMGWCDDPNSKFYNKQIKIKKNFKIRYEKLYRKDHKYDFLMRPPPSMTYRQRPRLREEIRSLMSAIDNTTNPPTAPQIDRIASLIKEVDEQEEIILSNESELLNLNRKLSSLPQILY